MKMRALSFGLLVALFAGSALLVTPSPAEARHDRFEHREWHHDRGDWRHDRRDWREHRRDWRDDRRGHARGHFKHKHAKTVVITRPPVHRTVVVREHHYHAYPPPHYVYQPAPVYRGYARDPAIVIGVDIPPIVIPIR
ncbi:MAG TPA: hypothetical protein PL143_07040 [Rhodocyclaceae bacterium]|nr:hypothetical protein [Rhodocyclaceae bacterium]